MSTTLDTFDSGGDSSGSDRPQDCECHDPGSEANLHAKDAHLKRSDDDPMPCLACWLDGFDSRNPNPPEGNDE